VSVHVAVCHNQYTFSPLHRGFRHSDITSGHRNAENPTETTTLHASHLAFEDDGTALEVPRGHPDGSHGTGMKPSDFGLPVVSTPNGRPPANEQASMTAYALAKATSFSKLGLRAPTPKWTTTRVPMLKPFEKETRRISILRSTRTEVVRPFLKEFD
jgi:hypothetical protein